MEADVLGVRIERRTRRDALDALRSLLAGPDPHSVYFVNAATANLAFENPRFCSVLNRGRLVFHDGVGVKWAARAGGVALDENLVGTDLVPALFEEPWPRPLRLYLLGGRPGIAARAASFLRRYPQVEVVGFAGGYFPAARENAVVMRIRSLEPDLLLVALGSPRQELFIDRYLEVLGCPVSMGVGGLFDHWAGELRRAPPWMRRLGLEWLQLLLQQPHKWRRYLLGNPKFLWRIYRRGLFASLRGVAISGLSIALALAGAEATVRLARPQILERYPEGFYVASDTRQYRMRPHFRGVFRYPEFRTEVRINGQGLREDRECSPSHPSVRRILALGDSFTAGYSVEQEQTWVRVLERLLSGRGRYEVINAGVPGYSTWQELAYLEEAGLSLAPNAILLGFFTGNDIADNASPALPLVLLDGRLISTEMQNGRLPFALRLGLARHSHLYHLARSAARRPAERYPEAGFQATVGLLDRLARLCAARAIRLTVVLMPEEHPGWPSPHPRLRRICARGGIEVIDLLDTFQGRAGSYFPQDGHWTAQGNAAAACAIFESLRHDAP